MSASELISSMDIVDYTKNRKAGRPTELSAKHERINARKAIDSIQDRTARETFENLLMSNKEVQSPDLAQLRLVSLAPRAAELRNRTTIFLNMLEGNPIVRLTDFQVRFRERRLGNDLAVLFNPNAGLPGEATAVRPMRTNTLGFVGNTLKIRFIAQELGNQSPVEPTDVRAEEIDFEITRIRRLMNSVLLNNTEVTSEAAGAVPQPGGFLTRSTLYNVAVGPNVDITEPMIQQQVNNIANITQPEGYGYSPLVCMLGGPSQLSKIRNLMITRYPGENSSAYLATSQAMMQRLADVDVPSELMMPFLPNPGFPVLFVYEPQLQVSNPGTAVFFDPVQPQLGKFQMMNQFGPWVLERPTSDILYLLLVFDSFTLIDNLVESRAITSGLNA